MSGLRFVIEKDAILISDYRQMIRVIRKVKPTLMDDLRTNIREIGAPAQSAVKQNIPPVAPLSGMIRVHHGTKTWGYGSPAKSVVIDVKTTGKTNAKGFITLGRLRVKSAATVIADMAGRSRKHIDKYDTTRPYMYRSYRNGQPVDYMRIHKIRGQGARMIDKLNQRQGTPSRFAWPAFENAQPELRLKAKSVLGKTFDSINSQIRKG